MKTVELVNLNIYRETIKMEFLGEKVTNFKELEDLVREDVEESLTLPVLKDVDEIHDFYEEFVETKDYEEFCKILEEGREKFTGIELDTEELYDAGMSFWLSSRGV